ncbi:MAG: hypothetical protein ACR2G7_06080 [Acidimicrobiales bacterium]
MVVQPPGPVDRAGARRVDRLVAVGVGVTRVESLGAAVDTVAAVRAALPRVPVLLGGQAVCDGEVARRAGATGWARDGRDLVGAVEAAVAGIPHLTSVLRGLSIAERCWLPVERSGSCPDPLPDQAGGLDHVG